MHLTLNLDSLNPEQRKAVLQTEGPVLILAGAGSGKTRTLTYRIAHMICNLGIGADSICAVSFTNKAAGEMKTRVSLLLKETLGKVPRKRPLLCTFHVLGLNILRKYIERLGYQLGFTLYDTADQMGVVRECLRGIRDEKKYDKKRLLSKISYLKNRGVSYQEFPHSSFFDEDDAYDVMVMHLYEKYQETLHFYNALDFDDILFLTVRLLRDSPDICSELGKQYRYFMIDEYQDTNAVQFELISLLTKEHQNLCVVGDDDQSIYSFRGANVENILQFEHHFAGAKIIKLEQNYRSTAPILELANTVIKENKHRKQKTLFTKELGGNPPLLWITQDDDHEATLIAEDILARMGRGERLNEVAILYRSNNQLRAVEDQLRLSQIPYKVIGGQKFYEKKEIKDLVAYLSFLKNPKDSLSLRRILNTPARGIGKATLQKIIQRSSECELFEEMKRHAKDISPKIETFVHQINDLRAQFQDRALPEAVDYLISEIGFRSHVEKTYPSAKEQSRRLSDLDQFRESAKSFSDTYGATGALNSFVEKLLLADSQDRQRSMGPNSPAGSNEVTLMTLHSSKGLEFNTVYFIGVEEEKIPHHKTIKLGEDVSEERRLAYVGITRAKRELILTRTKEKKAYNKTIPRHLSRFLGQATHLLSEQDRTNFGHMTEEEESEYKANFFKDLLGSLEL